MQSPISSFQPQLHRWTQQGAAAKTSVESFSAYADKVASGIDFDGSHSSARKPGVGEARVGPEANPTKEAPQVAICPECGSANCACLARVTLQKRMDEEAAAAQGVEKTAFAIVPRSFNQISMSLSTNGASSTPRF